VYDPAVGSGLPRPTPRPRTVFTATLLKSRKVLAAGFEQHELYNPVNQVWTTTGMLNPPRHFWTATL